jgi:anaerobic ribonucleoside-triphosphate reductase activating protein
LLTTKIYPKISSTFMDYPDDESTSLVVYFTGCEHNCPNCQNKQFQDKDYIESKEVTIEELYNFLFDLSYKYKTNKICFEGGDPLFKSNIDFVKQFLNIYGNVFDITIYTGYDIYYVKENQIEGFEFIKVGKYKEELKQESIKTDDYFQLASTNQQIYNRDFNLVSQDGRMYF